MKRWPLVLFVSAILLAGGCTTNVSRFQMPDADLDAIHTLYLEPADDERNASELRSLVVENLKERGYSVATRDVDAILPDGAFVLSIAADWHWDIAWYLLELRVAIYEANANMLVAQAHSQQSSLARKETTVIVDRALATLFNDPEESSGGD